jgi:hypothetical protein
VWVLPNLITDHFKETTERTPVSGFDQSVSDNLRCFTIYVPRYDPLDQARAACFWWTTNAE